MNTPTIQTTPAARVRDFTPLPRTGALYAELMADMKAKAEAAKASRDAWLNAPYAATQAKGKTE